ncbi:MAG: folate-binding protein YgfZ [Solirubrobacterales bacterium]|nr:folate-binding protein YgfZ [Solirubrobacterales bacterium]
MSAFAQVEVDAQYRAIREAAGLLERPERRIIRLTGADAVDYLQGQLTQDIEAIAPGESRYAALLDRKGHMQSDMRVLRVSERELLCELEPVGFDRVVRHLGMYKIGREVEVADAGDELIVLSLIGPASVEVAGIGPVGAEGTIREAEIDGVKALAVASDQGIDLFASRDAAEQLHAALRQAGAEPVDEPAAEIVRVESGRPRFGLEMSERTMPAEAGIIERAVSFTKGCYIGQETVARLHHRGKPNRHLRGLRLEAPVPPGEPVSKQGKEVGRLGTSVLSPARGAIGLAILRREAEPGDRVEVGDLGSGEVVELPFD